MLRRLVEEDASFILAQNELEKTRLDTLENHRYNTTAGKVSRQQETNLYLAVRVNFEEDPWLS